MGDNINRIDPQDEIQKLRDKVKSLELQLLSQNSNRNDLPKKIAPVNSIETVGDLRTSLSSNSVSYLDECELVTVDDVDFSNVETWLLTSTTSGAQKSQLDSQSFLHLNVNSNNNEFQAIRQCMLKRIEDLEQGSRRSIDTRTFTRPKNRMSRPALETMLESPIVENRQLTDNQLLSGSWLTVKNAQLLGRKLEDVLPDLDNCSILSLTSEPDNFNMTCSLSDKNTTHFSPEQVSAQLLSTTYYATEKANLNTMPVTQEPTFNDKRISQEQEVVFQNTVMNSTFTRVDGCGSSGSSHRSTRTPSCESGMDEDQLSSASDSSYSSANKPLSAGDVQIIAHFQEESLKQANSTPKRGIVDGTFFNVEEDLPSPISAPNGPEMNRGYLSDHSDQSSAESRAKSSRSSVRSSPSGSPFGSTQLLNNTVEYGPYRPTVGLPQRELKLIRPAVKPEFRRPEIPPMRPPESVGIRPSTRLRAPAVKPMGLSTGQTVGRISSGIPRPPSRLPTPRSRSSFVPPATKK